MRSCKKSWIDFSKKTIEYVIIFFAVNCSISLVNIFSVYLIVRWYPYEDLDSSDSSDDDKS